MSEVSFNTDPNQLTSFDGGSSPETTQTVFKYLWDFVKPHSDDNFSGEEATTSNVAANTAPTAAQIRKVTTFEWMFRQSNAKPASIKSSILRNDQERSPTADFKKYWMPDDQCKECYECGAVFSTFKRRHHCRLCGQIFCYDCCSDMISGKMPGYGDAEVQLRVCKFCLQLKSKSQQVVRKRSSTNKGLIFSPTLEKNEPEAPPLDHFSEFLQEELKEEDVWKINLHFMWSLFRCPDSSVPVQPHWHRFRYFASSYNRVDVIKWLNEHLQKTDEAETMLNAWIDTERLEPIDVNRTLFKIGSKDDYNENTVMLYEQIKKESENSTTNWIHRMVQEAKASSQAFDVQLSSNVSSYVHVDVTKDLDEEYWHSSEANLNTSHSLDDTIGMELTKTVESINSTARLLTKTEGKDTGFQNAKDHGIEVINQCIRQEKNPVPGLNIPAFGEMPDAAPSSTSSDIPIASIGKIYDDHMDCILDMLIDKEKIPSIWRSILKKLVSEAASDITPNPTGGDSMDIRKYVKFKKIYGKPDESISLDGYVFTKTVAHKKMKSRISGPKIMLMNGSISYQRVLNKLTSLNPVYLQEKEFLRKVVDRVTSFEPDVLIVEKSVSQIAKTELLKKGITLVLNLKQNQIDKIARAVQGDIIQNLDNITFIPASDDVSGNSKNKLGYCREFRAEFVKGFYGSTKPLLFFSGCDKRLTKTILLRGDNKLLLRRVKKVAAIYLYALYNSRLECNYLKRCQVYYGQVNDSKPVAKSRPTSDSTHISHSLDTDLETPEVGTSPLIESAINGNGRDDNDPTLFGSLDVTIDYDDASNSISSVESDYAAVQEKLFEDLVKKTIFSVTPFCRPSIPYLCTVHGSQCPTRTYFDEEIYCSVMFSPDSYVGDDPLTFTQHQQEESPHNRQASPTKPMITSFNADDLAYYRAFGHWQFEKELQGVEPEQGEGEECHPQAPYHIQNRLEQNMRGKELDCLNFYHHQKLLVLFSSLSKKSFNHPHPCISPWSLNMHYYGKNDLTLGLFLRDYCYLSTYQCPEQSCKTDIIDHERRFIHDGQCVSLVMTKLTVVLDSIANTPIMWSVCKKCLFMSDVSIVSKETWNYSFAKFLELKFYEKNLFIHGCPHSYHRYHTNFFALGNIVACFARNKVQISEICPLSCRFSFRENFTDITVSNSILINETVTKINMAIKAINDKVDNISGCDELVVKEAKAKVASEEASFKQQISEMSAAVSESPIDIRRSIYRIQYELVMSIDSWNKHLMNMNKDKRRPYKATSSQGSHLNQAPSTPALSVGSSELLNTEDDETPSPEGEKMGHKRVRSDSYLTLNKVTENRSRLQSVNCRSLDDQMFQKLIKNDSKLLESDIKVAEKHPESKLYSKMASRTKQFFTALTESYRKIELPFPQEEHHRLTGGSRPTVLVNEKHFTSIIAYALTCDQYRAKLQLLKPDETETPPEPEAVRTPIFRATPKPYSPSHCEEDKVGHWLTVTSNSTDLLEPAKQLPTHRRQKSSDFGSEHESVINKSNHIDVEFQDGPTKFFCKIYFAAEFDRLRSLLMPGEALSDFIHSLSICNKWRAKGGKSGLAFSKTQDDRWVVKEMSRLELQALLIFMPNYVEYVIDSIDKRPTLLAKIIGACTVGFNNSHSGVNMKQDVIIMENIFYNVTPSLVYDLKGSVRNRLAEEGEEVLLDENYLHHIVHYPVYLRPHSKTFLREAVNCDTAFLAAQSIIDYSLLVGMCGDRLVVGIIDYIRKFTFDKKVEMIFKTNMIGSAGRMPTIVSPEMYRERFCNQIERYFPLVPDKWTGMGSDLQYS